MYKHEQKQNSHYIFFKKENKRYHLKGDSNGKIVVYYMIKK